jgi:hypothetical protein
VLLWPHNFICLCVISNSRKFESTGRWWPTMALRPIQSFEKMASCFKSCRMWGWTDGLTQYGNLLKLIFILNNEASTKALYNLSLITVDYKCNRTQQWLTLWCLTPTCYSLWCSKWCQTSGIDKHQLPAFASLCRSHLNPGHLHITLGINFKNKWYIHF